MNNCILITIKLLNNSLLVSCVYHKLCIVLFCQVQVSLSITEGPPSSSPIFCSLILTSTCCVFFFSSEENDQKFLSSQKKMKNCNTAAEKRRAAGKILIFPAIYKQLVQLYKALLVLLIYSLRHGNEELSFISGRHPYPLAPIPQGTVGIKNIQFSFRTTIVVIKLLSTCNVYFFYLISVRNYEFLSEYSKQIMYFKNN